MLPKTNGKLVVEVAQRRKSTLKSDQIVELVLRKYLPGVQSQSKVIKAHTKHYPEPRPESADCINDNELATHVETICVCNEFGDEPTPENVAVYVFKIIDGGSVAQKLNDGNGTDDNDQTSSSNHWMLPTREYHGLWESLHFESNVKENLLQFVETSMLFAARNIDPHVISCNRLVLLHGPPGTGKTSLCKAIAQKLSVRLSKRYRFTHLIEINSHSLFSKWFSESGKLVMKLFDDIKTVLAHSSSLVCLLIDEVESIAFARNSVSENEPSDSLRVVNAVLTQLDQIRHHPNVLVLTTSNLTTTIDVAFMDRADIKQFIGNPTVPAIVAIYMSAVRELQRVGIITVRDANNDDDCWLAARLEPLAQESVGLSGRTLRKLPFLAHALHLHEETASLDVYLDAMMRALHRHKADAGQLQQQRSN